MVKIAKLCYMDIDSFIVHVKTDDIYKDIAEDIKARFDTSNYEIDRSLPTGKNLKSDLINERWIRWTHNEKIYWMMQMVLKKIKKNS